MLLALFLASIALAASEEISECQTEGLTTTVYTDNQNTLLGKNVDMSQFYGYVSVVINSASYSDLTWTMMPGMNALLEKYEAAGSSVVGLAFPTNQFDLGQPGTPIQIYNTYKHVRPGNGWTPHNNLYMFTVTDVNGVTTSDTFATLKSACPAYSENIGSKELFYWDDLAVRDLRKPYEKFLVDIHGNARYRFAPDVDMEQLYPFIDLLLLEVPILPPNTPVVEPVDLH